MMSAEALEEEEEDDLAWEFAMVDDINDPISQVRQSLRPHSYSVSHC